ncbi:MAG: DUF2807 domain-containing protein [Caulobacteraceae bacterium]|nr:DUF2807 domain-containing protein [Caulobacteraceae bacterium]
MKAVYAVSAALALVAFAGAAEAKGPEVEIKDAVARVVVIPEDRTDIAVEVVNGSRAELPHITVQRLAGGKVKLDGGLDSRGLLGHSRIRGCSTRGAAPSGGNPLDSLSSTTVRVADIGEVNMRETPIITIRAPRDVSVSANGAVFGWVGRANSVELGNAGCGDWVVAQTSGAVEISQAGSGDTTVATSGSLSVSMAGSGDVTAGPTGQLEVSIAGSGDVTVASVRGSVEASIAGSGDVTVNGGEATSVEANIAGSGDVTIKAAAGRVEANIMGSGDVTVQSASGPVSKSVMGSGTVTVGQD